MLMISYKLAPKRKDYFNMFKVTIVGDSNDADYITTTRWYSKSIFESQIINGLNDLNKKASDSYELREYENEYGLELPHSDWDICHSLESVSVEYVDEEGVSWDVEIEYEDEDEEDEEDEEE